MAAADLQDAKTAYVQNLGAQALNDYISGAVVLGQASGNDQTTYSFYNANNQILFTIDPNGAVTGSTYDSQGRLLNSTTYMTQVNVQALLKGAGGLTLSTLEGALNAQANSQTPLPPNPTTIYLYDAAGNQTYTIDPLGNVTQRQYDAFGNVIAVTRSAITDAAAALADPDGPSLDSALRRRPEIGESG
jgi:YD repeat-containing protein